MCIRDREYTGANDVDFEMEPETVVDPSVDFSKHQPATTKTADELAKGDELGF